MKLMLMAAALMLGGAAVAQTTEEDTETTTETTTTTTEAPEATTTAPPADASMPPLTTTMTMAPTTVAPDNSAPERDARGIAVISAPATAPAGYNQGPQTVPAGTPQPAMGPAPTMASAGELPPCTKTVTDRCTQTYERRRAR